jgi:hypothetical protein
MSNTYREPTEAETEAYKAALNEVVPTAKGRAQTIALAKTAIESVLGPCVYERLGAGRSQITQSTPDGNGAQVRFVLNADL